MSGKSFEVLGKGFEVQPLLDAIRPEMWHKGDRETYHGSAHAQAESIIARWSDVWPWEPISASHDRMKCKNMPMFAALQPALGKACESVVAHLHGELGLLGRVILTKLPPMATITRHTDEGQYADTYDRFHLCLKGTSDFECGGEILASAAGEAFWFNHKRTHAVYNGPDEERIHLIVDVVAPEYRKLRGTYFQEEKGSSLWPEINPLLARHWEEIAHHKDIPLAPDEATYAAIENQGSLRCYTARHNGDLIGYVVFFVRPSVHYKGSLQAIQDVLFVVPEHRVGMAGVRLIKFAEERLKALGVQVVYHHAKRTNRVGELLVRLGYELVDELYAKRLDG